MRLRQIFILLFVGLVSLKALACPCGCGAIGPLVMNPGDQWKMQYSLSRETNQGYHQANAELGSYSGAAGSDRVSFGLAKAINWDLSVSSNLSVKRDWHPSFASEYEFENPSFGMRYQLNRFEYLRPWYPKLDAYVSYSPYLQPEESSRRLDVSGSKSDEFVAGLEMWFDFEVWGLGMSHAFEYQDDYKQNVAGQEMERSHGLGQRSVLTGTYTYLGFGQIQASLERAEKAQDKINGQLIEASERLQHNVAMSANLRVGMRETLSVTGKKIASLGVNKNTKNASQINVSFIKAI